MGRQIQIFTTNSDNEKLRDFLIENFDCVFFQNFEINKNDLFGSDFTKYAQYSSINIWNKEFD